MKIAVLQGGRSAERDVSLRSGAQVASALRGLGHDVTGVDLDLDVWDRLRDGGFDCVFIALHGRLGEDGTVQGMLELLNLPYTGSGVLASALAMNKPMAKRVWHTQGLPTPDWQLVEKNAPWELTLPYPVVTKPSTEGSSVGVSIVRSRETFHSALAEAFRYDPEVLVEAYVPGKEVTVGILGEEALGAMEVIAKGEFHSYEVKYTAGLEEFILPAPLPPPVYERVLGMALAAHGALGCSGYSRVDIRVTDQGEVFLLEVNSLPGLTTLSWLPRIAAAAGFDYGDLIEAILRRAALHIQRVTP